MAESDSPYRRWLGLVQNPPNYFQLLGIERGECQPSALRAAAEARLGLLKSFSDAGGLAERKALAEEIRLAYATLSKAEKRKEYERELGSERLTAPVAPALAIPLAVPIVKPATQEAPAEETISPPPAVPSDPLAAVAAIESRQRRQRKRGARSWMLTSLAGLLFVGGPLLILGVIWFNSQGRLTPPAQRDGDPAKTVAQAKIPAAQNKPRESPFKGLTPLSASEPNAPEAKDPTDTSPNPNPMERDAPANESQSEGVGDEVDNPDGRPESIPAGFASPSLRELQRLIWNDLRYRDVDASVKRLQLAKGVLTAPNEIQQLDAVEELVQHVDRFWRQVIQSAAKLRTGDLKLGAESASFVESTDRYVMLKLKGVTVKVAWEYLPPEYAIEIAEQAPIGDIPSWRLAKAAGLMTSASKAREQAPLIRQWLDESSTDGHEIANLEWVFNCRLASPEPTSRLPIPDEAAQTAARKVLAELVPEKNLALNNVAGRRVRIEDLLNEAGRQADPAIKFVAIERAREQAIRLVDLPLCRELLESLATAFELDVEAQMLASAKEMAAYAQTPEQAESICEAILQSTGCDLTEFTKGSVDPKLLVQAEELARKQGLKLMLDRIRFLTGRE